ncbi:MAG: DUF1223 domain-containing protein [Candidatus Phaeomarinobacter sp.]
MTGLTSLTSRTSMRLAAPALLAAAMLLPATAQARPAVVELFTSQGCSSCPPADALINEVASRDDVIALTYNITYWDYLGWRDTLGREENTARQEAYAQHFMDRKYTPQLVIDGETHMPGSRQRASRNAINDQVEKVAGPATLVTTPSDTGLSVSADATRTSGTASVWLVQYDVAHEVMITRGENAGETITYSNVVRDIVRLDDWDMSTPLSIDLAKDMLMEGDHDGCAIIVQQAGDYGVGEVITAARIDMALMN